jgi:hypothetical protein
MHETFYENPAARQACRDESALAVLLYTLCNASLEMIARLLGVGDVAVLKWI